jgi:hypothetical protein
MRCTTGELQSSLCVLVYTSLNPGRNTSSPIVISTWINVLIPRNRSSTCLRISGLGCCSGSLHSAPNRELHCFTMRFSVYFALPRAQYIASHSNFYVNQCFYSENRFNYLLEHFRSWLLLWKFYSFELTILRMRPTRKLPSWLHSIAAKIRMSLITYFRGRKCRLFVEFTKPHYRLIKHRCHQLFCRQ